MKFHCKPIRLLVTLLSIVFLFQASVLSLSGETIQNTVSPGIETDFSAFLTNDGEETTTLPSQTEEETVYPIPIELFESISCSTDRFSSRMLEAEGDLSTVCMANTDGTVSMYFFPYPVKYVDENGQVKDKSNALTTHVRDGYAFINAENDIRTSFPDNVNNRPVRLTMGSYTIEVAPLTVPTRQSIADTFISLGSPIQAEKLDAETVLYEGAFGTDTAIRYQPQFNGYKEEIILYSEQANTRFSFRISCEGLLLRRQGDTLCYIDKETSETIFVTDPFFIYDSADDPHAYVETGFTLTELADSSYILTVAVSEDFLATDDLTWPVYVDPTIQYWSSSSTECAVVYSGTPDTVYSRTSTAYIGLRDSSYMKGRMLMRLTCLTDNIIFNNLEASDVESVTLGLYLQAYGSADTNLSLYQFGGSSAWTPSTASWTGVSANSLGTLADTQTVSSTKSGYVDFDITSTVKAWMAGTTAAEQKATRGLILLNTVETNTSKTRTVYTNANNPTFIPYVQLVYTPVLADGYYYMQNMGSGQYAEVESASLTAGTAIQQNSYHGQDHSLWQFTRQSNGYYRVNSKASGMYMCVPATASGSNVAVTQNSTSNNGALWAVLRADSGNLILISMPAARTGEVGNVLTVPSNSKTNGTDLKQNAYTNDTNYFDEWKLFAPSQYGCAPFRAFDEDDVPYNTVNCHGYAMQINYTPVPVYVDGNNNYVGGWYSEETFNAVKDTSVSLNDLAYLINRDFRNWLSSSASGLEPNKVTYHENLDWVEIDANTPIHEGQYRLVLRIGRNISNGQANVDYHFWYQTNDGTWTNKHGRTPVQHLLDGSYPELDSSPGWDGGSLRYTSEIYYYAITYDSVVSWNGGN